MSDNKQSPQELVEQALKQIYEVSSYKPLDPKDLFAIPTLALPEPPAALREPKKDPVVTAPRHTKKVFDMSSMPLIVKWAEELIYKLKVDAIAACGHSGLVLSGAVSYVTRVPVIAVRKDGEPTVAWGSGRVTTVLPAPAKRWIWLDDFILSGGTYRSAVEAMWSAEVIEHPSPVAILSYNSTNKAIKEAPLSWSKLRVEDLANFDGSWKNPPEYGFDA